jgi:polysaccharide pyruvyl transferase WcaK-like protein
MKNIVLLNAHAGGNKGAEAMLFTVLDYLVEIRFKDVVYIEQPRNNVELLDYSALIIKPFKYKPRSILFSYPSQIFINSMFVDLGGISFVDSQIRHELRNFWKFYPIIRKSSPLIFLTQDFGPTKKYLNRIFARIVLNRSKSIYCRSNYSRSNLIDCGINENKIRGVYPDMTVGLQGSKLKISRKRIVLSPSAIMENKYGPKYFNFFAELIHGLISGGLEPVLLVHTFGKNGDNSDLDLARRIQASTGLELIANDKLSCKELKAILSSAMLSITSRYHVLVGTISSNKPSISLGWNPKYRSFLELYSRENWELDFNSATVSETINIVNNIHDNFDEIESDLKRFNIEYSEKSSIPLKEVFGE